MKTKSLTAIALTAMAVISCSVDTDTLGSSLTNSSDVLEVSASTFNAFTRSVQVDSVYARNNETYFGQVKDPETNTYIKTEFMAQFNMQEGLILPNVSDILSLDGEGRVIADSCDLWLTFDKSNCFGDSLASLKLNMLELDRPMDEKVTYYSNYDPKANGFIRKDGLKKSMLFTMINLTDKNGVTYRNYGTYLLRNFDEHPEYFKNSYAFIHSLCPGFYFELGDGLGLMAKIQEMQIRVYYRYKKNSETLVSYLSSSSTPEVLQTTKITNDKEALRRLVSDESCTYLKSPSGIFTEVTMPVDEITQSHTNDSLLSVSIDFKRENSAIQQPYLLSAPKNIIMLPTDSLKTFFEEEKDYDYKSSYIASLSSSNCYSFSNIGNLITLLSNNKAKGLASDPDWLSKHPNWNKVMLVPISVSQTGSSSSSIAVVANQMGLCSTKLVGGKDSPIEVKVIYASFKNQ